MEKKEPHPTRTPLEKELLDLCLEVGTILPDKILDYAYQFYTPHETAKEEALEPLIRIRSILVEATARVLDIPEASIRAELAAIRNDDASEEEDW